MYDINKIQEVLPHRYPFLLIDKIVDFTPNESAHAIKCVTINEPFFQGHFPGRPMMPGVLIVEAIVQAACFAVAMNFQDTMKNPGVSFMTIDKCKFRKPVLPGDVLNLKVNTNASVAKSPWLASISMPSVVTAMRQSSHDVSAISFICPLIF